MTESLIQKIKDIEEKYNLIADNLIDAIWVIDAETLRYQYITPSIKKITGYTAEEFMHLSVRDRLTPASFQKVMSLILEEKKVYKTGSKKVHQLELELFNKSGKLIWVEIRARLYRDKNKSLKLIGTTREINEKKLHEQTQNELIKKLSDTLVEKEQLIREIKTLQGLLPICGGCKRIRDENNRWWPLDMYIAEHTDASLTHTICPDCSSILYGDIDDIKP
jgi:PAS domain S-box-containing protein